MRTLITLGMAAFVLGFVFAADLVATETWEQKLMDNGWVKQKDPFNAFADTTWYGRDGKYYPAENHILYFDINGTKVFFQFEKDSSIYTGKRWKDGNDTYCEFIEKLSFRLVNNCGVTVWKRVDAHLIAQDNGYIMHEYVVKKGNPEKF